MRVNTPALLTDHDALGGSGLKLAGAGFDLKKFLSSASKAANIGIGLAGALGDDKTRERAQQAAAVKSVLDGNGFRMPTSRLGLIKSVLDGDGFKMPTVSKKQGKKIKTAAKKGANIGLRLVEEFGNDSQKTKVAKVRKAKEIISGAGKPGADLRARLMKHHHGL